MLLIGLTFAALSNPAAFFKGIAWSSLFKTLGGYYLLPFAIVFGIAYCTLWIYSRSHHPVATNA